MMFKTTDNRTNKAKKNIEASILLKIIDAVAYLLIIPVSIDYLNSYEYGIWLTINSILTWIYSFDVGLGNGLRNKLASAIASKNFNLGKQYVSTTFIMLFLIMIIIAFIGLLMIDNINWYSLLNTNKDMVPNLTNVIKITFVIFCINFIFNFIGSVWQAAQLPAISNGIGVLGRVLSLLAIYILTVTTTGNLLYIAIAYSLSPTIIYLMMYPITFHIAYKEFKPSFNYFSFSSLRELCSLSIQFFIMQVSGLVLFSISNVIISNLFGPESVTPYNIANRYFGIVSMAIMVVIGPIWSATTDAYEKGDVSWIKKTSKKIIVFNIFATVLLAVMLLVSNIVYKIWIGNNVTISFAVSLGMALYVCVYIWSLSFAYFLNGMGKLRIQTINTIVVSLLFYPVCFYFGLRFGLVGMIIGMTLLNFSGMLLNIIQFHKVVNNSNNNFWLR